MSHEQNYEDPDVPHVPNWDTLTLTDMPMDKGAIYFDVWCEECGQSGTISILVDEDDDAVAWV